MYPDAVCELSVSIWEDTGISAADYTVSYDSGGRGNRSYQPRAFVDPSYSQSFSYPPPSADKTHGPPSVPAGGYPPPMSYPETASGYASQIFDNFLPTVAQSSQQIEYATAGDGGDADKEENSPANSGRSKEHSKKLA